MKIAIDLRPLQIGHENRGIGSYLLNVLEYFPRDDDVEYIFVRYEHSDPAKQYGIESGRRYTEVVLRRHEFSPEPKKLALFFLDQLSPGFKDLKSKNPDVFFQPDYLLGAPKISNCQIAVVCYDLIPLKFKSMYLPDWKKFINMRNLRFRSRARQTLRAYFYERRYEQGLKLLERADKIFSISEHTTKDLLEFTNTKRGKIVTIPLAASFRNKNEAVREEVRKAISELGKPYICFIGGTDKRRQVHKLISAFNTLKGRGYDIGLVFGGNEFVENSNKLDPLAKRAIEASSFKDDIVLLGKISESDKHYVMSRSICFVYPTLYEGFGLPILEAMQAGTPVVTYRNSSIPEITGESVLYVNEHSAMGIFHAVTSLIDDSKIRENLTEKAIKQEKKFTWDKTGNKTVNEIKELANKQV